MPIEVSSRKRTKDKIKVDSEEDSSSSRNEKSQKRKSNTNGELKRPLNETNSKSTTSIFTFFTFIVLILILTLSVGLILVELNIRQKGLAELLETYKGGVNSPTQKVPMSESNIYIENKDKKPKSVPNKSLDEFSKSSGSNSDEKIKPDTKTEKSINIMEEPLTKKVKVENNIPIKDAFPSSDKGEPSSSITPEKVLKEESDLDKEPKIISNEKLKELEKQIITNKEKVDLTLDAKSGPDRPIPSQSKQDVKADTQQPSKKGKAKESHSKLMDLYTEVEKLIEDILAQDPENDMVQELAPHIDGVVKDINSDKLSGIEESLLHIKEILLDLKERLKDPGEGQAKKLKDEDTVKKSSRELKPTTVTIDPNNANDYSNMDPVVEIIPDPVYIAPRESQPNDRPNSIKPDTIKDSASKIQSKEVESQPIVENNYEKSDDIVKENKKYTDFPPKESSKLDEILGSNTEETIPSVVEALEHSEKVVVTNQVENKIEKVLLTQEEKLENSKKKLVEETTNKKFDSDSPEEINKIENVIEGTISKSRKENKENPVLDVIPEHPDKLLETKTQSEKLMKHQKEKLPTPNNDSEKSESKLYSKDNLEPSLEKTDNPPSDEQRKINNLDDRPRPIQSYEKKLNKFDIKDELGNEEKLNEPNKNAKSNKEANENKPDTSTDDKLVNDEKLSKHDPITKPIINPKSKILDQDAKPFSDKKVKISTEDNKSINEEKLVTSDNKAQPINDSKTKQIKEEKLPIVIDAKEDIKSDKMVDQPDILIRKEEFIEESSNNSDFENELLLAESLIIKNPAESLNKFNKLLLKNPKSFRAIIGKAKSLHQLAEKEHSNTLLEKSIVTYFEAVNLVEEFPELVVSKELLREAIEACIDRLNFRGWRQKVAPLLIRIESFFPNDRKMQNLLGRAYLMTGSNTEAKQIFEKVLQSWPNDGFALVHYGFILKIVENNLTEGIKYLRQGIDTEEEGTVDGRFYLHLGDAYQRQGDEETAYKIYDTAVAKGLFLNRYQRSLHNIDRLKSQPVWTLEETTYEPFFKQLASNWEKILAEGLSLLDLDPSQGFKVESETLSKTGHWGQFELFSRGSKNSAHCKNAPFTCSLIESFPPASKNKRGQTKFSLLQPGTTVFNHTGPTNCRLRAHLGLITPPGAALKVAGNILTWEAGKIFIFDDSYEHEVWHKGDSLRLILIVDVWHPEITDEEKLGLTPI